MNFEQNFSPLDTESSEYQSINIVPLIEPISADPEQEEPKKPLAKIEQPVKIREIKPLPKVTAPKVDMAKVPKVERGQSFTFPAEEVDTLYNSFSDSSNYINGIISQKLKEFDSGGEQTKGAADSVRGYMSLINQANNPNDLAKRTDLVYNMMNEISDIQTNNATRDSFINSQYTPAFYSKSKALADEYNASDLKSVLTPRQYTGLKSLSYGKQGEYQDYLNTITDPKAKEVDKQLALLNLDKIGAAIDTNASAKLISDIKAGKADKNNLVFGRDLYLQSRYDLLNADEKIRDVEFNNPYNLSVAKNIVSRAVERGLLISESADMLSVSSDLSGVDVNRLIEIQRLQQDARSSKAFEEFYNNPSLETFSKNPIGILSELALESLVAMYTHGATRMGAGALEGAAIGTVIPGLGNVAGATSGVIAGIGLTSINLNMVSTILDGIAEAGYNTTSAEDLRKAFQDEKLMSKLKAEGWKSGTPLAIFDMLSVGLAGKIISKPARTIAGKIFAGTAELGAQAGFGMAGEAGKQIVTSGKINKPVDVFMEGLGEIGPGVPEIAFGAITEKAKNNQAQAKRDLAIVIDGIGLQKANDQIDVLIGSGQVSQEQGKKLKDETKKAFEQMQKMPSMLSNEARGQIMELVDKRDALMSGSENLDDVFKKQATKEAEAINAQILDIANKDISSQQKQRENAIKESRGTQQEVIPEGGISQYQGAQAIEAQKTAEADISNRPVGSTQEIESISKKLDDYEKSNPIQIEDVPDGAKISGGLIDLQVSAQEADKRPTQTTPSKLEFLPETINLVHLARNENDLNSILKNGFNVEEVNIDSPIPGVYFSSEDWSTMDRFGRERQNALSTKIKNNGLVYFNSNGDFIKFLNDNNLPSKGQTLSKNQIDYLKSKGIKGIVLREDFASGSRNELIVIDPSIIESTKRYEGEDVTKLPSSFTNSSSIAELYLKSKQEGTNKKFVSSVDNLLNNQPIGNTQERVAFQKSDKLLKLSNVNISQIDDITATMNQMETPSVEFKVDDAVKVGSKADVNNLVARTTNAATPKVVSVSDFLGKPIMVTISDELTTGNVVNPATGNTIAGLMGGIGFNYTEGNTGYAWAYTDEATAQDTLNTAKEIYKRNPEMFPDGIVPVAVVKMGTEAINSNEAVFRVLLDNLNSLPKKNLTNAYKQLRVDISNEVARIEARQKALKAQGKPLSPSERNALNGYKQILNDYLNKNKSIPDVIANISELNINTRPLIMDRITSGEVGLLTDVNRLRADKPVTKALMEGLPKEDIKKIHLGWITEPLRDPSIKNVPARHVIGFVGIDATADSIQKSGHPNYPFALKGMGLGVVEDTVHLASIMPTAYGNAVKKITDAVANNKRITPAESVSRAMPSGLANAIFKGKPIVEQESELSKLIGFLNLSFPSVTFFTDQQSFEDIVASPDVKKYVREGEIIYGLTTDGKIYLNPSIATANTAIHEMGHIWVDYVQNMNPELFNKGISLVEGTDEFEKAKAQLGDNINARKEALAMLIGNRGETITNAAQKSKFKEWLVGLWKFLQEQFPALRSLKPEQIETLTLEQFLGGALQDILSGKPISEKPEEYVNIGAAAQKMSDIVPFEPQLPEGPQGPTPPGEVIPSEVPSGEVRRTDQWFDTFMKGRMSKQVGEPMIETSTGKFVGLTNMRGQIMEINRKLKEAKSSISERLKKIYNYTKLVSGDNQQLIFALLDYAGRSGQLVQAYLRTRNSASDTSNILVDVVTKDIFGGLSKTKMYTFGDNKISEYVLFNHMIGYQRIISIQQQMDETYEQMKAEWKKIKPQFDAVQEAKTRLDKAKSILSTDEFKSLSEIEKAVIRDRVNTIEKELSSLNAKFARDSREYNKNKQRLIDNNMIDESGVYIGETLSKEFAQGDITATQAYKNLQEIRELIGEEEFSKLMTRSQAYSQFFNRMLKARMEAGIVSQDTYNYLSKFFYAPTRYISDVLSNPILSMAVPTSSYKAQKLKIKNLSGGSERLNVSDYEGLMKAVIYASEYSISENETASRLYIEVENNEELYAKIGVRLGVKYIPIEEKADSKNTDIIDDNLNRITEGKKPSSLKVLPSGQKQLPYNGIQKVNKNILSLDKVSIEDLPLGDFGEEYLDAEVVVDENGKRFLAVDLPANQATEGYINIYVNGKENRLIVPKGIAEAWYNENITKGVIPQIASFLGKWTGVNALRLLATGASPTFGIFQVLKDVPSAYAATIGERKYRPLILDFPSFFTNSIKPVFKDILTNSKDYQEARAYGATTNFYNGGSVSFERGLQGVVKKSLEEKLSESRIPILGPVLKWYISISKKIAETMEQTTKIALYKDIRNKKIKEYKDKNGIEPTGLDLEDIRVEAAAAARSVADFHRRGVLGGPANMVFGYLNAQIQVQDAVLKSSVNNKAKTIAYTMEFGSYVTIAILYSLGAFDEDEEKKIKKRKAYDRLSDYEKDNYIPLYYIESEDKFFKLPIAEFLSPVVTIIRRSLYRTVVEKNYKASSSEYRDDILESAKSVLSEYPELQILKPEEKILSRNPTYSAMSKLFANWDPYRQERVVDEDYERKTPAYLEGILNQKSPSSKILQEIGKSAKDYAPLIFPEGISPKKLDAAMKSWPFETNPFTGGLEYLINTKAMDKKGFEEKYGKDALSQILKVSGVSQRFFTRATNISNGIVNIPIKEVKDRTEFRIKLEMDIVPKFDSLLKDMSRIDAYKKITREFVSNHIKNKDNSQNLSPEQAEIARNWFTTRFRDIVKAGVDDPIVNQIIKMETGDAKLDAIDKTLNNIQLTDSAKLKFLKDLYDAGVMNSENIRERINQRGNRNMITKNGERVENPYFEPGIGYIRDNMIKIAQEKRAKQ